MSGLFLLDVQILPGAYIKDVVHRSQLAIKTGTASGGGKVLALYKVSGESRIIAVLENGLSAAEEQLNNVSGETISVTCTPLRSYETYARSVLDVDPRLCAPGPPDLATEGRQLYWLQMDVTQRGLSHEELLSHWQKEASFLLCERMVGQKDLVLYKVAGQNRVHLFTSVASAEVIDDGLLNFPHTKLMGDNVSTTCKSIVLL